MKARFVLACAAAGFALMGFGATTASAEADYGTFDISPDVALPGDELTLTATCDHPGFTAPAAIESGALASDGLTGEQDENGVWQLTGTATVLPDVEPGQWSALFQCGPEGNVVVAQFEVGTVGEPYAAIGVTDKVIKPGQEVQVTAGCHDARFESSKIESPVLTAPDFVREKGQPVDAVLFSEGKIAENTKPGTYPISFTCVDRKITNEFTVVAGSASAQVPVKPKGAPETGSLAPEDGDSSGALLAGAGAAVLLAAGGAGLAARRRRA